MPDPIAMIDLKESLKGPINSLLTFFGSELKQLFLNRIWDYQETEFKRNLYSKTILHRSEPKSLEEFYQPLYLRDLDENDKGVRKNTRSVQKLFQRERQITIIGFAGSGKSTLVKYLITRCFVEGYRIPIKVELRYLNDYEKSLKSYIVEEVIKFNKIGLADNIVDRMLESDNFLFFFDGYDEINSAKKPWVSHEIDAFVTRFSQNSYLLTSRPNTNVEMLSTFKNYFVCDLQLNEIRDFVKKQIPKEEIELSGKIISAIDKKENSNYRSFLSNPLLLSMFILTFQTYSAVPQRRSEFYNQVFNALFSMHDSMSKMAYVREKQSGLSKDQFEEVLRIFSYISFFEQEYIYTPTYLSAKLDEIKAKKPKFAFDNDKLVEDLQVAIGIINKEGLDFTFPHRSLQEYFAASYIEKLSEENKRRIYGKLLGEIRRSFQVLLEKDHFFSLLVEMDFKNLHRWLTLPLIEELLGKLVGIHDAGSISDEFAFLLYEKVFLVSVILLRDSACSDLFKKVIRHDFPLVIVFENQIKSFLEEKSRFSQEIFERIDEIKRHVLRFKSIGREIVHVLTDQLDEVERSDGEIIDLVAGPT